jgi:hypothetical protein
MVKIRNGAPLRRPRRAATVPKTLADYETTGPMIKRLLVAGDLLQEIPAQSFHGLRDRRNKDRRRLKNPGDRHVA